MRILQFQYVFLWGPTFPAWPSFWVSFGVSREHFWEPHGTLRGFSWVTLRILGVLGVQLGASWDPSAVQLGLLGSLMTQILASVGGHRLIPGPKIQSRPNIEGPGPCPGPWPRVFWPLSRSVARYPRPCP